VLTKGKFVAKWSRPPTRIARFGIAAFVLCGLLAGPLGCTNNLLKSAARLTGGNIESNVPPPNESSMLTLSRVVKSTYRPGSFDLVGDGSGAMGQYCVSKENSGGGQNSEEGGASATTCKCVYTFTNPNGNEETIEADTVYRESNLIRCGYDGSSSPEAIPSAVSKVAVKIHITQLDGAYSNELNVSLMGTGSTLDPTDSASFVLAQRYQCRDIVHIPYLFDVQLYDPIQSEDPRLAYALNFFTTNMGRAMALYAGDTTYSWKWHCPSKPNDPAMNFDLTVYSLGIAAGSKIIYPPQDRQHDRSTFYLAKAPTGVFSVPINAYIIPGRNTTANTNGNPYPPIGWAATPVATSSNTETCPDNTVIPPGFHWAKLWLFRADLPARQYRTSTGITRLGRIDCNPGTYPTGGQVFPNCLGMPAIGDAVVAPSVPLAARILYPYSCVMLNGLTDPCAIGPVGNGPGWDGPGCTTQANGSAIRSPMNGTSSGAFDYSPYPLPLGTDVWRADAAFCTDRSKPMNLCTGSDGFPNPNSPSKSTRVPYDDSAGTWASYPVPLDHADFLFVVSPVTIMAADMQNSSVTKRDPYIPYRFMGKGDCLSPDPDHPAPGDCDPRRRINYGLKLHDIGNNGDPPANDPTRPGVFPACVIQPD